MISVMVSEGNSAIPSVNVVENFLCLTRIVAFDVLFNPRNEVVFKCPFNDLMKNIWCNQLVDIRSREIFSKGLEKTLRGIFR